MAYLGALLHCERYMTDLTPDLLHRHVIISHHPPNGGKEGIALLHVHVLPLLTLTWMARAEEIGILCMYVGVVCFACVLKLQSEEK